MNLFGELRELLGGEIAIKTAAILGEKEDKVKIAINGLISTFVGGIMKRVSNETGATTLMNVIKKGNHDGSVIDKLDDYLKSKENFAVLLEQGNGLVSMLLPDKKSSIATMMSQFAGVRNSSATAILSIVAPVVMSKLGRMVNNQGLDKIALANVLLDQKSYLLDETPESLQPKMIDVLGLGVFMSQEIKPIQFAPAAPIKSASVHNTVASKRVEEQPVTYSNKEYDDNSGGMSIPKWLLPAFLIALVIGGIGYFAATFDWNHWNMSSSDSIDTTQVEQVTGATIDTNNLAKDTTTAKVDSANAPAVTVPTSTNIGVSLPNGEKIDLVDGSFNYNLAKYLTDSSAKVNRTFTFDNLNFESNTVSLVAGSEKTVQDLAKIMAAYPKMQIKLTGYTDNLGDSLQNRKLSSKRAFAIRNMLVANGVKDIRIDFMGRGSANPVATNATEEGKAKNRRIELRVLKK
jgi:OOP family OmpA-OmpF porin